MLSFLLKDCTDCSTLDDAICSVEGALAQYGKDGWQNITYMTQKPVPYNRIRQLMYYRDILETLKWSQGTYCPPFNVPNITSRAAAIAGSITPIVRRNKLPVYTTTTTTTTTSTSTTSTTSTTTSTTTSSTTTSTTTSVPSTWAYTVNNLAVGTFSITVTGVNEVSTTTTGSGTLLINGGAFVSAFVSGNASGHTLTITDTTASIILYNATSPSTVAYSFTATPSHIYTVVGSINTTTTTTTTTSTTTTTTTHTTTTTTTTTTHTTTTSSTTTTTTT